MTLKTRTLLVLFGVSLGFAALVIVTLQTFVVPAFLELERQQAERNAVRARAALNGHVAQLRAAARDWANWDDTYQFALGNAPAYAENNLNVVSLANIDVDFMLLFDRHGRELAGFAVGSDGTPAPDTRRLFASAGRYGGRLLAHGSGRDGASGFIATDPGPAAVASMPILTSTRQGPVAGTILLGRYLDARRVAAIRSLAAVHVELLPHARGAPARHTPAPPDGGPGSALELKSSRAQIVSDDVVADIAGSPLLVVRVTAGRDIVKVGVAAIRLTLGTLLAGAALLALAIWITQQLLIIRPLEFLAGHMAELKRNGDLTRRVNLHRRDEIGALAAAFDELIVDLRTAQARILEQSYRAGMAEVAAVVLHDVRNAMNPLMNQVSRSAKTLCELTLQRVRQAAVEMAAAHTAQERRDKLCDYVQRATEHCDRSVRSVVEELGSARQHGHTIEVILRSQERLTHVKPVSEILSVLELVDDAVRSVAPQEAAAAGVHLDADAGDHRIFAPRIPVLEILRSVLTNAQAAIARSGSDSGEIRISASRCQDADKPMVQLAITDNGVGLSAEQTARLFEHGDTTTAAGAVGHGLHWCANAIAGFGGRMRAESAGSGQGSTLYLLLPEAAPAATSGA